MSKSAHLRKHRTGRGPKVRSYIAQDAHMRSSAGAMGGSARAKNRRSRQDSRQNLRGGIFE